MAIVQEMNLNMIPDSIPVIVRVDQYDTGVGRLVAHLYNGQNQYTPAEGATAIIQGTKPDNKGFAYNAVLNGSTVTADLETQMSCVGGNTRCQFVVTEPSGRTGTFAFVLKVQDSALADDTDISETDLPVYIDAAQKAAEEAEAAAATYPYINPDNYHWMVWDVENEQYVDTGVVAQGSGLTPGNGINIQGGVISVDADSEPTENSTKPVTSGGVYTSLQDKMDNLSPGANIQIENNVISATDTTYENATTEEAGLMSAADKTKLNGIEAGAQVNVQTDWDENDSSADDFLKNKPTLGTAAAKDSTSSVTDGSTDLVESGAVKSAIDTAVSSAYKAAGTKTCAELVAALLVKANQGNVYNMTDAGTTTADFVEGAGHPIRIGDNVGIVKVGSDYKFDLLSGFVDTSGFQTKAITSPVEGQSTVEGALSALSSNKQPKTLSSSITVDGIAQTTVEGALSAINTLAGNNKTAVGKAYSTDDVASADLDDDDYLPIYDSSASAKKKTLWSNIKSKLKTYFDTLYATITDVTSKFAASVSLLDDTVGWVGGNLFNGKATSEESQGVTWSVDASDDNIITVSGTPTGFKAFVIKSNKVLPAGDYILSGISDMVNVVWNSAILFKNDSTVRDLNIQDVNTPKSFSILPTDDYDEIRVTLKRSTNGVACSGTGKLMIITPEQYALNPAYRPYHESVEDWYWDNNAKLGVHNNFNFPYRSMGGADSGGTFIINSDKTVTASGTFTGNAEFRVMDYITDNRYEGWIISSNAEFSGDFYIRIREALSDDSFVREIKETNGQIVIPHMNSGHKYYVGCRVGTTGSAINVTLKPTLSVPDDTYKGYTEPTMTNRELTDAVARKQLTLSTAHTVTDNINKIIKVGNVVCMTLKVTLANNVDAWGSGSPEKYLCNIPEGCRPDDYFVGFGTVNNEVASFYINKSGNIQFIKAASQSNVVMFSAMYII